MAGLLIGGGGVAQSWTVLGWPRKCAPSLKHFLMIFKGFLSHCQVILRGGGKAEDDASVNP